MHPNFSNKTHILFEGLISVEHAAAGLTAERPWLNRSLRLTQTPAELKLKDFLTYTVTSQQVQDTKEPTLRLR